MFVTGNLQFFINNFSLIVHKLAQIEQAARDRQDRSEGRISEGLGTSLRRRTISNPDLSRRKLLLTFRLPNAKKIKEILKLFIIVRALFATEKKLLHVKKRKIHRVFRRSKTYFLPRADFIFARKRVIMCLGTRDFF